MEKKYKNGIHWLVKFQLSQVSACRTLMNIDLANLKQLTQQEKNMPQFLIAIHRPLDYDPVIAEDAAMKQEISDLNKAMQSAGIIVFVGGLTPPGSARSIRIQANGEATIKQGIYLGSNEHVGGFWVVETPGLDEALSWGQKAAAACRAPVEVRPFHSRA
jgi:hypothetical protein